MVAESPGAQQLLRDAVEFLHIGLVLRRALKRGIVARAAARLDSALAAADDLFLWNQWREQKKVA